MDRTKKQNLKFLLGRNYREYFDLNYTNCIHFLTPQHYYRKNNNKNIRAIIETEGLLSKNLIHLTFSKVTIKKIQKYLFGKNTKHLKFKTFNKSIKYRSNWNTQIPPYRCL